MATTPVDISLLPPVAKRLVSRLGLDGALAVIHAYGGLPFYVPHAPDDEIIAALGLETAEAFCWHFGGEVFTHIPACITALLDQRNRAIVAAVNAGESKATLARRYKISWRQIHNISQGRRNGHDDPIADGPQQTSLLDLLDE